MRLGVNCVVLCCVVVGIIDKAKNEMDLNPGQAISPHRLIFHLSHPFSE